jgi:hypothetical protein
MWVKLDDTLAEHPKIERAGPLAAWLYVCGLCYCARQLTDGRIPKAKVPRLADVPQAVKHAARLVEVGLWEDDGDDYVVHDWLAYNPGKAKVIANRQANARRVTRHRNGHRNGVTDEEGNA